MKISRHGGVLTGWPEAHISTNEFANAPVVGNVNAISTRNSRNGKIDSMTFFGEPRVRSGFSSGNK